MGHFSLCIIYSQEALLKALHKVCIQMKLINILNSKTTTLTSPTTITSTILAQCRKKQQPAYQLVAMETIGGVVSSLEVDVFSEFSEIALPILLPVSKIVYIHMYITVPVFVSQPSSSDGRESEEEEEGEKREAAALRLQLREKTAEAVGKTWPSCAETQGIALSVLVYLNMNYRLLFSCTV